MPGHASEKIRVLIADSTPMGCQLLAEALQRSGDGIVVVGRAARSDLALKVLAERKPDVALISANLEDGPRAGLDLLRGVRAWHPGTRTVLLIDSSAPEIVLDAFRGGAKGLFCRSGSLAALCKSIHAVQEGQIWATSAELQLMLEVLARSASLYSRNGHAKAVLTRREQEVISLVAEGLTNREIAQRLRLSAHTVKNYLFRMFEKLGISSRVELVLYALERCGNGLFLSP